MRKSSFCLTWENRNCIRGILQRKQFILTVFISLIVTLSTSFIFLFLQMSGISVIRPHFCIKHSSSIRQISIFTNKQTFIQMIILILCKKLSHQYWWIILQSFLWSETPLNSFLSAALVAISCKKGLELFAFYINLYKSLDLMVCSMQVHMHPGRLKLNSDNSWRASHINPRSNKKIPQK